MNTSRETLKTTVPGGGQRRRLALAGRAKPVASARGFTLTALDDWSWPGADDVVLLVAELVANAMLHTDGPLDLVLDATDARLRIEVNDPSPALPVPRQPHLPHLPGGHGLYIVRRTSDRWGSTPHPQGKTVWAEIDADRPAAP
ncbi:ATP-binding protein [Kitasatospora sp. NPDC051853]|uniref:ATP-binding protein n=1 Tax=Kitasatospora sp. NPDC051853 TaxID=3364058 RepID=UPI0037A769DB